MTPANRCGQRGMATPVPLSRLHPARFELASAGVYSHNAGGASALQFASTL